MRPCAARGRAPGRDHPEGEPMSGTVRVSELLLRWEELEEGGRPVSLRDLCAGCPEVLPELRRRVRALADLDDLLGGPAGGPRRPPRRGCRLRPPARGRPCRPPPAMRCWASWGAAAWA